MRSVAIFIEGGGDSRDAKVALRHGFDQLFARQKDAARLRKLLWKVVFCGGRNATFEDFVYETKKASAADVVVLLVDAEGPVTGITPQERVSHLANRDGWNLQDVQAERVHLMTQCMEAWIVADPDKLEEFYGKHFQKSALPKRQILDEEPKANLSSALQAATKDTQKGSYHKIKHAAQLLKRVRPNVVTARCRSFLQLTAWLDEIII